MDEAFPSRVEMIRVLRAAQVPPSPPEPTRAQMIASLRSNQAPISAASTPQPASEGENMAMDLLPTAGGIVGGLAGAAAGTAVAPGPGTVAGSIGGAAVGGAAGSAVKDYLNSALFGQKKDVVESLKDAAKEGGTQAVFQGFGEALPLVGKIPGVKQAASKVGEFVFHVPSEVIQTYAENSKKIMELFKSNDGNIAAAADSVKQKFMSELDGFRQAMNQDIGEVLKGSDKVIEAKPIVDALEESKAKLNPTLHKEQILQIGDLIGKVNELGGRAKEIGVAEAHQLKQYLQDFAKSAYRDPGQIFQGGTQAAEAAKAGGAVTRKLINEAVPEVAEANGKLHALHVIEDNMNKSLLAEGKSEAALLAAGKGNSKQHQLALEKLTNLTGHDFVTPAKELAAAQTFGAPSVKGTGLGATVGGLAGGAAGAMIGGHGIGGVSGFGAGAAAGAAAGGAMTSPLALKSAIDLSQLAPTKYAASRGIAKLGDVMKGNGGVNSLQKTGESGR